MQICSSQSRTWARGDLHQPLFAVWRGNEQHAQMIMPWPSSTQAATRASLITMASIHSGEMFRPDAVTSRLSFRPVDRRESRSCRAGRDRRSATALRRARP